MLRPHGQRAGGGLCSYGCGAAGEKVKLMNTTGPDAREYIYKAWAPPEAVWSPWVKPVLFSVMGKFPPPPLLPAASFDLSWVPAQNRGVAIVLDLLEEEGVLLGLELAKQ